MCWHVRVYVFMRVYVCVCLSPPPLLIDSAGRGSVPTASSTTISNPGSDTSSEWRWMATMPPVRGLADVAVGSRGLADMADVAGGSRGLAGGSRGLDDMADMTGFLRGLAYMA